MSWKLEYWTLAKLILFYVNISGVHPPVLLLIFPPKNNYSFSQYSTKKSNSNDQCLKLLSCLNYCFNNNYLIDLLLMQHTASHGGWWGNAFRVYNNYRLIIPQVGHDKSISIDFKRLGVGEHTKWLTHAQPTVQLGVQRW